MAKYYKEKQKARKQLQSVATEDVLNFKSKGWNINKRTCKSQSKTVLIDLRISVCCLLFVVHTETNTICPLSSVCQLLCSFCFHYIFRISVLQFQLNTDLKETPGPHHSGWAKVNKQCLRGGPSASHRREEQRDKKRKEESTQGGTVSKRESAVEQSRRKLPLFFFNFDQIPTLFGWQFSPSLIQLDRRWKEQSLSFEKRSVDIKNENKMSTTTAF